MNKICLDCGERKPLEEFTGNNRNPDKKSCYCKVCMKERNRVNWLRRRYGNANKQ